MSPPLQGSGHLLYKYLPKRWEMGNVPKANKCGVWVLVWWSSRQLPIFACTEVVSPFYGTHGEMDLGLFGELPHSEAITGTLWPHV